VECETSTSGLFATTIENKKKSPRATASKQKHRKHQNARQHHYKGKARQLMPQTQNTKETEYSESE
jgi:hypothetical protein